MGTVRTLVWFECVAAWTLWLPTAFVAVHGVLRQAVASGRVSRRGLWIALLTPTALLTLWFLVPFPYGSSSAVNLTGSFQWNNDFYKGASDRVLLWMLAPGMSLGAYAIMFTSRAHVVILSFVGLALLASRRNLPASLATERGRNVWLLLLLLGPGVVFGLSKGTYYGSIPIAMSTLLLALQIRGDVSRWIPIVLIPTSLWIVALSRPESVLVSVLMALFLLHAAIRQRDRALIAALGLVLCLLAVPLVDSGTVIDKAVRTKRSLMGSHILGSAPWTTVLVELIARAVVRIPLSMGGLFVASAGLLWLAFLRATTGARARQAVPERLAALYLLLYVAAAAIHEDGIFAWLKYLLISSVPVWYLAAGAFDVPHVRRHLRLYQVAVPLLVGAASLGCTVFLTMERTTTARQTTLDLDIAPRMAALLCQGKDAPLYIFKIIEGDGEDLLRFTDRAPLEGYGVQREAQRMCGMMPSKEMTYTMPGLTAGAPIYDPIAFLCTGTTAGQADARPATRALVALSVRAGMTAAKILADPRNCGWSEGLSYGNVSVLIRSTTRAEP